MKRLFAITVIVSVLANQAFSLTWQDVLAQASQKSNAIKSARKQLESYQWSYYKSYSGFLPQISASFSSSASNNYSYGISASQALFKGLQNYYTWLTARTNLDYYRVNLQNAEADTYYQIRQAFINLYIAQQNVAVREKIRQYRAENERMIKLLYNSGKEDNGNYLRTKAQLADAEYNVVAAGRQLELTQIKLAQLIDTSTANAEGEMTASGIPMPDIDALTKKSTAYLMAKGQLELADIAQKGSISEFLPNVSLSGSLQQSGNSWPPTNSGNSLSLSVSLPIFPGGSNFADRAIYGIQLEKAREDFAKNQKDIYYAIKEAYENLKNAIDGYSVQQKFLDSSDERARISQVKYLNGLTSYYEWDQVQNEFINNQISLLNYNRNALIAEANWYKSYGGYIK